MFGRWLKSGASAPAASGAEQVNALVREHLPTADPETVRVVVAIAGLLATVAYADREYSEAEERHTREALGRIHGMTEVGLNAICDALRRHAVEASTVQLPRYARDLLDLGDRELRLEVLDTLVDLAAADGELTMDETSLLRTVTRAIGLGPDDYVASQTRHRERLSVLKPR
jgi:uncharacterized tellurite resistance protein B-like protein